MSQHEWFVNKLFHIHALCKRFSPNPTEHCLFFQLFFLFCKIVIYMPLQSRRRVNLMHHYVFKIKMLRHRAQATFVSRGMVLNMCASALFLIW